MAFELYVSRVIVIFERYFFKSVEEMAEPNVTTCEQFIFTIVNFKKYEAVLIDPNFSLFV